MNNNEVKTKKVATTKSSTTGEVKKTSAAVSKAKATAKTTTTKSTAAKSTAAKSTTAKTTAAKTTEKKPLSATKTTTAKKPLSSSKKTTTTEKKPLSATKTTTTIKPTIKTTEPVNSTVTSKITKRPTVVLKDSQSVADKTTKKQATQNKLEEIVKKIEAIKAKSTTEEDKGLESSEVYQKAINLIKSRKESEKAQEQAQEQAQEPVQEKVQEKLQEPVQEQAQEETPVVEAVLEPVPVVIPVSLPVEEQVDKPVEQEPQAEDFQERYNEILRKIEELKAKNNLVDEETDELSKNNLDVPVVNNTPTEEVVSEDNLNKQTEEPQETSQLPLESTSSEEIKLDEEKVENREDETNEVKEEEIKVDEANEEVKEDEANEEENKEVKEEVNEIDTKEASQEASQETSQEVSQEEVSEEEEVKEVEVEKQDEETTSNKEEEIDKEFAQALILPSLTEQKEIEEVKENSDEKEQVELEEALILPSLKQEEKEENEEEEIEEVKVVTEEQMKNLKFKEALNLKLEEDFLVKVLLKELNNETIEELYEAGNNSDFETKPKVLSEFIYFVLNFKKSKKNKCNLTFEKMKEEQNSTLMCIACFFGIKKAIANKKKANIKVLLKHMKKTNKRSVFYKLSKLFIKYKVSDVTFGKYKKQFFKGIEKLFSKKQKKLTEMEYNAYAMVLIDSYGNGYNTSSSKGLSIYKKFSKKMSLEAKKYCLMHLGKNYLMHRDHKKARKAFMLLGDVSEDKFNSLTHLALARKKVETFEELFAKVKITKLKEYTLLLEEAKNNPDLQLKIEEFKENSVKWGKVGKDKKMRKIRKFLFTIGFISSLVFLTLMVLIDFDKGFIYGLIGCALMPLSSFYTNNFKTKVKGFIFKLLLGLIIAGIFVVYKYELIDLSFLPF